MIIDPVKLETPDTPVGGAVGSWGWRISWVIRGGAGEGDGENLRADNRQGFWPSHPSVSFRLSLTRPHAEGQRHGS